MVLFNCQEKQNHIGGYKECLKAKKEALNITLTIQL